MRMKYHLRAFELKHIASLSMTPDMIISTKYMNELGAFFCGGWGVWKLRYLVRSDDFTYYAF